MRPAMGALCLAIVMTACAGTPDYYEWVPYSDSVWRATSGDGQMDTGADNDALNTTVEKAIAGGKRVPPGMHAHIGMLCTRAVVNSTRRSLRSSLKSPVPRKRKVHGPLDWTNSRRWQRQQ